MERSGRASPLSARARERASEANLPTASPAEEATTKRRRLSGITAFALPIHGLKLMPGSVWRVSGRGSVLPESGQELVSQRMIGMALEKLAQRSFRLRHPAFDNINLCQIDIRLVEIRG